MAFWNRECDKNNGETQKKEVLEMKEEDDIIRLSDFESIAHKVRSLSKPFDIQGSKLHLTEKEQRIVSALELVAKVSLFNEFKHLKDKIRNHHHVTLTVDDGIEFRENGNRVHRADKPAVGTGTAR